MKRRSLRVCLCRQVLPYIVFVERPLVALCGGGPCTRVPGALRANAWCLRSMAASAPMRVGRLLDSKSSRANG